MILATFTAEGDATAQLHCARSVPPSPGYTADKTRPGHPTGIELEYTDVATVAHAILGRRDASRGKERFCFFPIRE